ncbi:YrhB domain-containing protein [Phytopseudomonas straminea]|uniref:YrhB domain-containing protein n=1 Tax=Pseudomonas straminea TaxID=47882 RepID=UPI001160CC9A
MVISIKQAELLARSELERITQGSNDKLDIMPEHTIVRPLVCAFFYQSQEYILTQEFSSQLVGHGPLLINRSTGEILSAGSYPSPEIQIQELEQKISRMRNL